MPRQQIEREIGNKTYIIKELTVNQILQLFGGELGDDGAISISKVAEDGANKLFEDINEVMEILKKAIGFCCPELEVKILIGLAPSELEDIWEDFKKVNKSFFAVLKGLGVLEVLQGVFEEVKEKVLSDFSKIAVI